MENQIKELKKIIERERDLAKNERDALQKLTDDKFVLHGRVEAFNRCLQEISKIIDYEK